MTAKNLGRTALCSGEVSAAYTNVADWPCISRVVCGTDEWSQVRENHPYKLPTKMPNQWFMRKLVSAVMVLPALSVAGCGGEEVSAPPARADLEQVEPEDSKASSAADTDPADQAAAETLQSEAVDEPQPRVQQAANQ